MVALEAKMVRQIEVQRRTKSAWRRFFLAILIAWCLFQGYNVWDLADRRQRLSATATGLGSQIGLALAYNAGLQRILTEWAIGTVLMGALVLVCSGRVKKQKIWVDDHGNEVRGPDF